MEQDHEKHLLCREGVHQSPIDIEDVVGTNAEELQSDYSGAPIQIINNRHTVLLKYPSGSYLEWGGERFELIQFHFHHPSEHRIGGQSFPMEIHLVHKTADHEYVVIAVWVRVGKRNAAIQKLWDRIPEEIDRERIFKNEFVNAKDLLPASSKGYYQYSGSLTTPPCTESVTWLVFEEPIEVSNEQVRWFQKFIDQNARPAQKRHHRIIVKRQGQSGE